MGWKLLSSIAASTVSIHWGHEWGTLSLNYASRFPELMLACAGRWAAAVRAEMHSRVGLLPNMVYGCNVVTQ